MQPEKNLQANIPTALLAEAERLAGEQHVSMDEFLQDAVQRYLNESGWKKLYAYGERQARKLDIKEEDVERIIHEFREEERESQDSDYKR